MKEELKKKDIKGKKKKIVQEQFLEHLEENGGCVNLAARASGTDRETVYRWKREEVEFSKQWEIAIDYVNETVEQIFYQHFCTGEKPNMTGVMFWLKTRCGYSEKGSNDKETEINYRRFDDSKSETSSQGDK